MKRDTTAVIWRTVVFAGAMLGAPACSKSKPAATTPSNTSSKASNGGDTGMAPTDGKAATKPDPNGEPNPCAGGPDPRPRGTDDENGGGMGRGFVLS